MPSAIVSSLIRFRWPLLALGILIVAVAYPFSLRVEFDRSIENMFAPDDPLLAPFKKLKETFGGNEIVLAVYEDPELLDPSGCGIERLAKISRELQQAPGVQQQGVLSLAEVNQTLVTLDKLTPFLSIGDGQQPPILDPKSELSAKFRELFAGYTHSYDGRTVAIAVMLVPQQETKVPRRDTIDALRETMEHLPDDLSPGMLAGEPVMLTDGFRYLEADGRRLGVTSMILLALVIVVCFRSLRWVLIPIAVVEWSLIVTRALLAIGGFKLSMVSSMLTAIVTVVGIATVVHVIVRFRDEMQSGETRAPRSALLSAGTVLLSPILWSCLTDAVGFGSLLFARVGPVQDFGLMTAIGSLLVLPAVALLLPGLALLGNIDVVPKHAWGEAWIDRRLKEFIHAVEHYPRTLLAIILLLSILAVTGSFLTKVETDFTKNFRSTSPVVQSYAFIETHLGGAGVWDIILPAPAKLDDAYLARVRKLEEQLRAIELPDPETGEPRRALTKVISLADADEAAKASRILAALPIKMRSRGMQTAMPTFSNALYNAAPAADGRHYVRIMLRAHERQGAGEKKQLIGEVERLAQAAFPASAGQPGAEVTGFFVLLTNLIESLLADQWLTFGMASLGIFLMLIVALRSLKLSLIALVPNALPIFFALGGLGWLSVLGVSDLKMNMGSAMIAAVSMGLSVDSSIHYILSYQRARREQGHGTIGALHVAQSGVGMAMVFSTLALLVGFSVLATSEFMPTVYFGALVSLAMLGGMLGNLLVLPLLIRLCEPRQ
jgi:predicted RND superfamily exporter protein